MHLEHFFLSAIFLFHLNPINALILPSGTSTGIEPRAAGLPSFVPGEDLPIPSQVLRKRHQWQARSPAETNAPGGGGGTQFIFTGFDAGQILIVRRAIRDAAWLGQMGAAELANMNSVNDLSPAFRTYFGAQYAAGRMDIIRENVNRLANILNNNVIQNIFNASQQPNGRPNAVASLNWVTGVLTIYPRFFANNIPNLGSLAPFASANNDPTQLNLYINRGVAIAHEVMHTESMENVAFTFDEQHLIDDLLWADVNVPGTPTYNGNFPTSEVVIYSPQNSASLAEFDQLAAMQNASNWQWYLLAVWMARYIAGNLPGKPNFPNSKMMAREILEAAGALEPRIAQLTDALLS